MVPGMKEFDYPSRLKTEVMVIGRMQE